MKTKLTKYKVLSILYPLIHFLGYILIVLLADGTSGPTLVVGFFAIYSVIIFIFLLLGESLLRRYICNSPKVINGILVIAIVLLCVTFFFSIASNFDFVDKLGNVEGRKQREPTCLLLYLTCSTWFATYIKINRINEIDEELEEQYNDLEIDE